MTSIHDDLRDRVARLFAERGYAVRTEVQVRDRRVDVVASNEEETLLIEVVKSHYAGEIPLEELEISQLRVQVKPPPKPRSKGCLVIKRIPCGKNCSGCPHGPYVYRVKKVDGRQVWEYLGKAEER